MSLRLSQSNGIEAKTGMFCECHGRGKVNIYRPEHAAGPGNPAFDICITMEDFFGLAQYVLENTPLDGHNDPRAKFIEYAKTLSACRVPKEGLRLVSARK